MVIITGSDTVTSLLEDRIVVRVQKRKHEERKIMAVDTQFIKKYAHQEKRFVLAIEDAKGTRIVNLEKKLYTIGRGSTNSIVIHSPLVSRYHATLVGINNLEDSNDRFELSDGDLEGNPSANVFLINGKRTCYHILQQNDVITFGVNAKARFLLVTENLSDEKNWDDCEAGKFSPVSAEKIDCFSTVEISGSQNNATSQRFASLTEFLPIPIIQMSAYGERTYLNPAALIKFTSLQKEQLQHSILRGVINAINAGKKKGFYPRSRS